MHQKQEAFGDEPFDARPESTNQIRLERSMQVAVESQLLAMGVLLERTTEAMEQQAGQFKAALSGLEGRNKQLQAELEGRDKQLRQAAVEIKKLTVSRGAAVRDAKRLAEELRGAEANLVTQAGSDMARPLESPRTPWQALMRLPRILIRETTTRQAKGKQ